MQKEGYWINYRTDEYFPVYEHERWIRDEENAVKLGLSQLVIDSFSRFKKRVDRDKFLLYLMKMSPIIRVRGHGQSMTFEFSSNSFDSLAAIWEFGKKILGPFSRIHIVNFGKRESLDFSFREFDKMMRDGSISEISKVASKIKMKSGITRELDKITRMIK